MYTTLPIKDTSKDMYFQNPRFLLFREVPSDHFEYNQNQEALKALQRGNVTLSDAVELHGIPDLIDYAIFPNTWEHHKIHIYHVTPTEAESHNLSDSTIKSSRFIIQSEFTNFKDFQRFLVCNKPTFSLTVQCILDEYTKQYGHETRLNGFDTARRVLMDISKVYGKEINLMDLTYYPVGYPASTLNIAKYADCDETSELLLPLCAAGYVQIKPKQNVMFSRYVLHVVNMIKLGWVELASMFLHAFKYSNSKEYNQLVHEVVNDNSVVLKELAELYAKKSYLTMALLKHLGLTTTTYKLEVFNYNSASTIKTYYGTDNHLYDVLIRKYGFSVKDVKNTPTSGQNSKFQFTLLPCLAPTKDLGVCDE